VARTQTLVQLSDVLLAALDQRAARRGVSRSQIIREAIEAHLSDDLDDSVSRRIVAGYERIPQATPDEWGDPAKFTAATARDAHRRLDAEERSAGSEPW
jgi:predicted DNA-binding protein